MAHSAVNLCKILLFRMIIHHVFCNDWKVIMMTSSNGNFFRVTGPLCGEFTGPGEFPTQRPVTQSFAVFFDMRLNKRLSKQQWSWWFETPSWSLWRNGNGMVPVQLVVPCRVTLPRHIQPQANRDDRTWYDIAKQDEAISSDSQKETCPLCVWLYLYNTL